MYISSQMNRGGILTFTTGQRYRDIWDVNTRDTANHPSTYRIACKTINRPAQNAHGANISHKP